MVQEGPVGMWVVAVVVGLWVEAEAPQAALVEMAEHLATR